MDTMGPFNEFRIVLSPPITRSLLVLKLSYAMLLLDSSHP